MQTLATLYRAAQFFAHNAHHLAQGPTFYQDHEELGEIYGAYESAYDALIEQMIGLGQKPDLKAILSDATNMANEVGEPSNNTASFMVLLTLEKRIQDEIKRLLDDGQTDGTENLLQGLAQDSEKRANYKIGQRVK